MLLLMSCVTGKTKIELPALKRPVPASMRAEPRENGQWMSEEDFRNLLNYLKEINAYCDKLESRIDFYQTMSAGE